MSPRWPVRATRYARTRNPHSKGSAVWAGRSDTQRAAILSALEYGAESAAHGRHYTAAEFFDKAASYAAVSGYPHLAAKARCAADKAKERHGQEKRDPGVL